MIEQRVLSLLYTLRLPLSDEKRLQVEIAEHFTAADIAFEREVRLSQADVIDFLVGGDIGIEIKIKGGKRDIYHQVERYAQHERINSLILATNVPMGFPAELNGKPVYLCNLARAWL